MKSSSRVCSLVASSLLVLLASGCDRGSGDVEARKSEDKADGSEAKAEAKADEDGEAKADTKVADAKGADRVLRRLPARGPRR